MLKRFRHILRALGRSPGFTVVALMTLAIGIGANTAVFSVINSVLIRPLPYPDAGRLVGVWHVAPGVPSIPGNLNCSPTMYFTYREESETFEQFGLWSLGGASVTGVGDPEQVQALFVTQGTLDALGVAPLLGSWFSEADDTPGSEDTVMLTYGYWQRRFGGDGSIVGRALQVDSRLRRVIGVMPQGFRFLNGDADLILPHKFDRSTVFLGNFSYQGLARLKPGVTIEEANRDIERMLPIWLSTWPVPPGLDRTLFENARVGPRIQPLKQEVVGDIGQVLWVLMGTIGLVLLIACANVANLLLVRAEARRHELAIRTALGAGWRRIAGELLMESLTLGLMGGALGLGLAWAGLRLLVYLGPGTLPRLEEISIDPVVVMFTLAVSLFSGLLFGAIPAVKYAVPRIAAVLAGGGRTLSASRERHRARNSLVVVQVAMALVLLVGAGLMIRTFRALNDVRPGFTRPAEVQLLRVSIPPGQLEDAVGVMRLQQQMGEKLAALPGVVSVGFGSSVPMEGFNSNDALYAEDREYAAGEIPAIRRFRFVAPEYSQTLGTPIVAGRGYTWTDLYEIRSVAVVSENLARELWGDPQAALGKRIRNGTVGPWREVIGVAGDVRDDGVHEEAPRMVYWPALMGTFWGEDVRVTRSGVFAVRTERAATESFLDEARGAIWTVSPDQPVFLVRTLQEVYDASIARTSFTLTMLMIAGAMALTLGIVGIYGVISYAVTQRRREIGIRMALGARPVVLKRMFLGDALVLAGFGVGIGLAAAAGVSRVLASLLFETSPLDPLTFATVPLVLILTVLVATYLPAERAAGVDPMEALRLE